MKVLYIITRAVLGGAQIHVLELLRQALQNGKAGLVTYESGTLVDMAREMGVDVWVLSSPVDSINPLKDLRTIRSIHRIIRVYMPDVVHCHSSKAGVAGRIAAWLAGVPAVFTAHGWAFSDGISSRRKRFARAIERFVAPISSSIICVSKYDFDLALRYVVTSKEKMHVVRNGIANIGPTAAHSQRETIRCVMVARFSAQKDQISLVRAMPHLDKHLELLLVGEGELLEETRNEARALGIDDRIKFTGNRYDIPEILADCDIFAHVSNWEGFPYSILEAMRAGLPVVASDVGGVCEAVNDSVTGYLVPRGDSALLIEKLKTLASDSAMRQVMGAAGRKRFLDNFTLDRMLDGVDAVYQQVLGTKTCK